MTSELFYLETNREYRDRQKFLWIKELRQNFRERTETYHKYVLNESSDNVFFILEYSDAVKKYRKSMNELLLKFQEEGLSIIDTLKKECLAQKEQTND